MEENKKYEILLIEDDQMLVRMYVIKMEKEGLKVDVASNGKEGLEKLKNKQYDLALLDLMMPTMDGFQLLDNYNKSKEYKKLPIVVLSNLGQKEDIERAQALGIGEDDYIVKANMTPSEVIDKVKRTIKSYVENKK